MADETPEARWSGRRRRTCCDHRIAWTHGRAGAGGSGVHARGDRRSTRERLRPDGGDARTYHSRFGRTSEPATTITSSWCAPLPIPRSRSVASPPSPLASLCARSRSSRTRQEHSASGSRHDAHVRDVRPPDPPATPVRPSGTPDPLTIRTCAFGGHFCAGGGAVDRLGFHAAIA